MPSSKKLRLRAETLSDLVTDELRSVAGGTHVGCNDTHMTCVAIVSFDRECASRLNLCFVYSRLAPCVTTDHGLSRVTC